MGRKNRRHGQDERTTSVKGLQDELNRWWQRRHNWIEPTEYRQQRTNGDNNRDNQPQTSR